MNIPMNVLKYCANEVERQHAGPQEVVGMAVAWDYALHMSNLLRAPGVNSVMIMAASIEKGNTPSSHNNTNWRTTNVMINNEVTGSKPEHIDRQMSMWEQSLQEACWIWEKEFPRDEIDMQVKRLLDIHPWKDGNGRTASLVYNWLRGTLDEPVPLPYYYGEHQQ